ncbi:MAG: M14-type cytosolic carboxypeptidase [Verrucomicrobiota bacterium]
MAALCCLEGHLAVAPANVITNPPGFIYLDTAIENGSPLSWNIRQDGAILISLVYDHEYNTPNRANGHWNFRLMGKPGAELTLVFTNFDNIYNGRLGSPITEKTHCFASRDGQAWQALPMHKDTNHNTLELRLKLEGDSLYLARLEPYRISDLDKLKARIQTHADVGIQIIGKTVEGRELEILRVGREDAPYRVFCRARAHPWEPGGNWVLHGMVEAMLRDLDAGGDYARRFCIYLLPMANKDGVAHGRTRFNLHGRDINRNWNEPADATLCPENAALEQWLQGMIAKGKKPHLAIDWHNDNNGAMMVYRPANDSVACLARLKRVEDLMRAHTWFDRRCSISTNKVGTINEGWPDRFGVDTFVQELNADWIAKLDKPPLGKDWEKLGADMLKVFCEYFGTPTR